MRLLTFILLLTACTINAQVLDNTNGKTFGETPFFNEDFIRRNKVKFMKGYYSTKADLDYIRNSKDVYYYEFNIKGQLITDYRTQNKDTIIAYYEYDDQGRLALMRKSDNGGFYAYYFRYDDAGNIIEKEFRRDLNKTGDKTNFQLDRTFIVSTEKFSYVNMEGKDFKKIYYNNIGKVYKEEFYYYNEFGNIKKQESRMKMGSGYSYTIYEYDFKGRVSKKRLEKHFAGNSKSEWVYEYDEHDNILAQHYYKQEKYISEHQIVYDETTFLLGAIIARDDETNFVTIIQFSDYGYFD